MSTISASQLGHVYRSGEWALRDVSFDLPAGSVTALVGANAAGKTTLLEVLAGVRTPAAGDYSAGSRIRLVAHDKPLYLRMTVADHLEFGRRANTRWNDELAREWLRDFNVPLRSRCGALSAGQRAQVALALALGAESSTLLLDEVLANMDPVVRGDVVSALLGINADSGVTIVLSTHSPAELAGAVDHLLVLASGRLVAAGQVDELLNSHRRYVGPRADRTVAGQLPVSGEVIWSDPRSRQTTALVRHPRPIATVPPGWSSNPVTLDELVHDYLRAAHHRTDQRAPIQLVDTEAS